MNPSLSTRNFVGGLFGGLAGILLSHYIHPLAIPFGVLVGVVLGWWHMEIIHSVANARQRARTVAGGFAQVIDEAIVWLGRMCGLPLVFVRGVRWLAVKAIIGPIVWLATAPSRLRRFNADHPMNWGRTIEMCAHLATVAIGVGVGAWVFLGLPMGKGPDSGGGAVFGALLGMMVAMFGALAPQLRDEGKPAEMSAFYREWEILDRYGAWGLFAYGVGRNIRYAVGVAAFVTIIVCWGFPLGAAFMVGTFIVFPVLGMVRGFYLAVQRPGHWLCFGITLTMTGLSWLYFHSMFTNDAVVWSVALITGVASGVATELVRRPILTFYSGTRFGRWLAQPLGDTVMGKHFGDEYLLEQHDGYMGIGIALSAVWLGQSKAARFLRALCFGTPVVRPVKVV